MRLWTVRMRELHNMASMVDGKVENLVISRKRRRPGANRLPCIGLNPTRPAYFGSDGCKKVRNEFPLLQLVQTYIRLD